jgi:putative drug exporter of the RND superfamily
VGGIGALIVLALVFGSLLALLPIVVAVVSIMAAFLAIGAVTSVAPVSVLVEYLIALIGLGVAIDYSLLVVNRWREERARGRSNHEAVATAVATAGRTVAFSGVTVGIGLLALVLLPIPFMRSLGYAGILIPLMSVVVAVTLLPALLAVAGPRLEWPRRRRAVPALPALPGTSRLARPSRVWAAWARGVIRHRVLAVAAALIVLGILLGAASTMRVGEVRPGSLATSGPAATGLEALGQNGFPSGLLDPVEVLVPAGENPAAVAAGLRTLPGAYTAAAPAGPQWRHGGTAVIDVVPETSTTSAANTALLNGVRSRLNVVAPGAVATGDGLIELDVVHALYGRSGLILGLVGLVTLLILTVAFRSIVLAVKALLLNVLSVGAVMGVLVLVWQHGFGSRAIWGIPATAAVVDFVPLMVFAFLFGLSMDYEVFIVSRMREARDAGQSPDDAVVTGIAHTGRLVTSAALVLVLAFAALAATPEVSLKMFATGLGAGILLDATVVRALLLPAVVSLLGERAWRLPLSRRPPAGAPLVAAGSGQ